MSFEDLKNNKEDKLTKLVDTVKKADEGNSYTDERYWYPDTDEAGNGYSVIRFLPISEGDDHEWIAYWSHGFKGPTGQWYIERSLTSLGKDDPVGELNSRLWNSGVESDKDIARTQKRKQHYVCNILVIDDQLNPENNGKVFLFKFGKKIFDKIKDAMTTTFKDEKAINPFDYWDGANFKMKIRKVDGYRNYDKSEFDAPSALFEGDETKLKALYESQYSLKGEADPDKHYKTYDELKARLNKVLDVKSEQSLSDMNKMNEADNSAPWNNSPAPTEPETATPTLEQTPQEKTQEEGDLSYFDNLAKQS